MVAVVNGGEIRALAALEARVESLGERLNRAEGKRDEHFAKIYGRLDGIEAAINVSKGRASIIGGVKMTGKEGPYEIGLLDVYTNSNNDLGIPKTNYAALRIKRDVLQRSYIGFMGLSRDSEIRDDYNRTFAVDGSFSFDNNINVNGYFAKTQTPGLKGKDINGFVDFSWGTDKFSTHASFTDIGENFNPEMGFLQWNDIRRYTLQLTASPRPKFLNTRQTYLSYELEYITDHNNQLQYRIIEPKITNFFNDESYIFVGLSNYYDRVQFPFELGSTVIPPGIYKYNVFAVSYGSDLSRKISGIVQGGAGSFYNGEFQGVGLYTYLRICHLNSYTMA
ncbi:hypothetical protein IIA28_19155 [candidate division KSB1 bacterium]|nr:hypothetical protein [candidate division KSB1 bacterium]